MTNINMLLKEVRIASGVSQQDYAKIAGKCNTYISKMESSMGVVTVTVDMLIKYSNLLGVKPHKMMMTLELFLSKDKDRALKELNKLKKATYEHTHSTNTTTTEG